MSLAIAMTIRARQTALAVLALILAACAANPARQAPPDGAQLRIGLIETTDIHSNILSYDYYRLAPDDSLGLERAATLIRAARREFDNSLTFDAGDTIQGTALADWQAQVEPLRCDRELAIYKAMDAIGYDAGTIGNHEFNYGLAFLSRATGTPFAIPGIAREQCRGPHFPLVLSNLVAAQDGKPLFAPWRILERTMIARTPAGETFEVPLRVGVIGFTPVGIMAWDRRNLQGKVMALGMVEAARQYVPQMRKAGADIVVALVHGGLDPSPYTPQTENAGWHLAGVPGIDALLLGHSHAIFPGNPRSVYAKMPQVDNERGFVRGVPAVMGNYYGRDIGLIDLRLIRRDGRWQVDANDTHAEVRAVKNANGSAVAADPTIERAVASEHAGAIAYVETPIGHSDFSMTSYFAAAGDTSALTLVARAQRDFAEKAIAADAPSLAGIPLLTAVSPFKTGFGGPQDFTDVPAGALAIHNAADLYLYPNTLTVVKIDGAGLKAWLETSARWFNRIDPARHDAQPLLDPRFPGYDFDVIQGDLTYAIDLTRPLGERIADLRWRGQKVRDEQPFLVATNNYRASGGGKFPGLTGANIVLASDRGNREILIDYVKAHGDIARAVFGDERNWRFVPVRTAGPVVFTSAAGKLDLARAAGLTDLTQLKDNGDGSAVYAIDLSR